MSEIIERVPANIIHHTRESIECPICGCGYSNKTQPQPCDTIFNGKLCIGVMEYKFEEWDTRERAYVIVRCDCGQELTCDDFTNTCDCGTDYNWSGHRLAPREQWGEETGETAADILMGGDPFED